MAATRKRRLPSQRTDAGLDQYRAIAFKVSGPAKRGLRGKAKQRTVERYRADVMNSVMSEACKFSKSER